MKKAHLHAAVTTLLVIQMTCMAAFAHDLWVTPNDYRLGQTAMASMVVFNAHQFPAVEKDILPSDRVDRVFVIAPDGSQVKYNAEADQYLSAAPLKQNGTYMAVALPINGFFTRTTQGYQRGKNKKDLTGAIDCRYSEKYAKSLFTVGKAGGEVFSRTLGHSMEIVPLKDPATLREGEFLPVKVLLDGKPARTLVLGTYAGFSDLPNTWAYATHTDREGLARIQLIHAGNWLLLAKENAAYPDTTECDTLSRAASLTFNID
jgi:uncharacterized GH25 family protein